MKKHLTLMAILLLLVRSALGQGLVFFSGGASAVTRISTNTYAGGPAAGLTQGSGGYVFALFYSTTATDVNGQATPTSGSSNPSSYVFNDSRWHLVGYGTNSAQAGRTLSISTNPDGSLVVPGVAGGNHVNLVALGWSANIGTDITAVQNWYNSGSFSTGWIGQSSVGVSLLLGDGGAYGTVNAFGIGSGQFPGFLLGEIPSDYTPPGSPPVILGQPGDVMVQVGSNATFSVSASGTSPLLYQWSFDGTNLANATNATLALTGVQLTNAGNYSVSITNASGSTNSRAAVLTVTTVPAYPPYITQQPGNQTVTGGNGSSAVFSVTAGGTSPLYYQWSFNGTGLSNATNATLTVPNVQSNNAGYYSVAITNAFGTTNSIAVTLTVTYPWGFVFFATGASSTTKIMTNSAVGGSATGLTATNVPLYYYALYASATATSANGNTNAIAGNNGQPYVWADPAWSLVGYGVNVTLPGRSKALNTDAFGQVSVTGFAGGTRAQFVVVGWSASIGSDIPSVQSWYNGGNPASDGWIGQSMVGAPLLLGDGGIIPTLSVFGIGPGQVRGFLLGLVSAAPNAHYNPAILPAPVLTTTRTSSSIVLSWPAMYSNYGVQSATSFAGPWNDVSATPVVQGTNLTVTLPLAGSPPYFRLIVQ